MRGLLQIVVLEWRALIRTGVLPALWLFAFLWTYFAPLWLVSDGTDEGAREIFLTYGVGTVFVLALIAFGASAAGALSKERAAKRLQLSLVRPVPAFVLAWGRMLAHTAGFATVVAVALGAAALHGDGARPAYHVRHPILQTPAEEAREAYAGYMRSAETPEAVKKMKKESVLRILEQKSFERYETIPANATAVWRFPLPTGGKASRPWLARFKFASLYETRGTVCGIVSCGEARVAVSNAIQASLRVPLAGAGSGKGASSVLVSFRNTGRNTLMLRPRKDVQLLEPAGTYGGNLVRAGLELVALAALVVAFAVFLGAGLGRSVAIFTLLGFLFVSAIGPDVLESYPDPLETRRVDRMGLALTRGVWRLTRPFSRPLPTRALVADEYTENAEILESLLVNLVVAPVVLAGLAAFCLRRKEEGL